MLAAAAGAIVMNDIANCTAISEPTAQDQYALGTGWRDVLLTAFNRMIAEDIIEPADDEEPDPWAADMPGWRRAADQYHSNRAGRALIVEIEPRRRAWLQRLTAPNVTIDHAWTEIQRGRA
jgi:hypothetical protein